MNKEPTLRQKWNGLKQYLREPKTRFDLKDWAKAIASIALITGILASVINKIGK